MHALGRHRGGATKRVNIEELDMERMPMECYLAMMTGLPLTSST